MRGGTLFVLNFLGRRTFRVFGPSTEPQYPKSYHTPRNALLDLTDMFRVDHDHGLCQPQVMCSPAMNAEVLLQPWRQEQSRELKILKTLTSTPAWLQQEKRRCAERLSPCVSPRECIVFGVSLGWSIANVHGNAMLCYSFARVLFRARAARRYRTPEKHSM